MEKGHLIAFLKDRGFILNKSHIFALYKSFDGTPSDATGAKAASAFLDGLCQASGITVADFHMQTVTVKSTFHTYVTAVVDYTEALEEACAKVNKAVNSYLMSLSPGYLRSLEAIVYIPEKKCFGMSSRCYSSILGETTKSITPNPDAHLEDVVLDIFREALPKCLQPNV